MKDTGMTDKRGKKSELDVFSAKFNLLHNFR